MQVYLYILHTVNPHNSLMFVAEQQYLAISKNKKFATWSANNSIRLRDVKSAIINDNVFANINSVSISTRQSFEKTSNDYETTLQGAI